MFFASVFFCLSLTIVILVESNAISISEFSDLTNKKFILSFFYSKDCPHSTATKPVVNELGTYFAGKKKYSLDVQVLDVDCAVSAPVCASQSVFGYPTIKLYRPQRDPVRFKGDRRTSDLVDFVEGHVNGSLDEEHSSVTPSLISGTKLSMPEFGILTRYGTHFLLFHVPWCKPCREFGPIWAALAREEADKQTGVHMATIDCDDNRVLCDNLSVKGYPTVMGVHNGLERFRREGSRTKDEIVNLMTQQIVFQDKYMRESAGQIPQPIFREAVLDLDESTWDTDLKEGLTFVKFYAPWCSHCRRLAPIWAELGAAVEARGNRLSVDDDDNADGGGEEDSAAPRLQIARVNCDTRPALCRRYDVAAFPTLLLLDRGRRVATYDGPRHLSAMRHFLRSVAAAHWDDFLRPLPPAPEEVAHRTEL